MVITGLTKQPAEVLRQKINYAYWLDGAFVRSVTTVVDPVDPVTPLTTTTMLHEDQSEISLFIAGGSDDADYTVTITVAIYDGQVREDELKIRVKEIV